MVWLMPLQTGNLAERAQEGDAKEEMKGGNEGSERQWMGVEEKGAG